MKKYKNIIFILLFAISVSACEENFSPKGELKEAYALNCILSMDTPYQVATLSKGYDVDGFDPYINDEDPSIVGADIRIWQGDSVYTFRDTTAPRMDTSRYNSPLKFYYLDNFKPDNNAQIEVEVLLPNGRRLKSSTKTPGYFEFKRDESIRIIPPDSINVIRVVWESSETDLYFLPRLIIEYSLTEGNQVETHSAEIPAQYVESGGDLIPYFPQPSNQGGVTYELDAITTALSEISNGNPNKENYLITSVYLDVTILDGSLTRYFSVATQGTSRFTVRVNESDYTNIEGGFGVFGSFRTDRYSLRFFEDYIESFGYRIDDGV